MERRSRQVLSLVVLGLVLFGTWYVADRAYEDAYERVEVRYHSIRSYSLGYHRQGDLVRARVIVDEGSVKVLEGRVAVVQLLDSDNRATMERGEGYVPLTETVIDTKTTDIGYLEYTAHRGDTYYIVYRNEDWWNLTLKVADGHALTSQLYIKAFAGGLFLTTIVIFAWLYGRLFDVQIRQQLGLVRRKRGPGSQAAREPGATGKGPRTQG